AHPPRRAGGFGPCRPVAWTRLGSGPPAMLAWRFTSGQPVISYVIGWLVAAVVLGWRLTRSWQDARVYGRQPARSQSAAGPHGETVGRSAPPAIIGRGGRSPAGPGRVVRGTGGAPTQQVAVGGAAHPGPAR